LSSLDADVLSEYGIFRETWVNSCKPATLLADTVYTPPACRINKLRASTCHRCRCSRWENNSSCWFVWKFKAHTFDCTILQLGLHIQLFGLHKIGWTAPLEYALRRSRLSWQHFFSRHLNFCCNYKFTWKNQPSNEGVRQ